MIINPPFFLYKIYKFYSKKIKLHNSLQTEPKEFVESSFSPSKVVKLTASILNMEILNLNDSIMKNHSRASSFV
jgi:hypothetical protein